ncbi:MAG: hypothetical protein HUU10_12840 [Bacteroidetes bacterium]|nr:hypothetical protein [Bacteroidota bacterium]
MEDHYHFLDLDNYCPACGEYQSVVDIETGVEKNTYCEHLVFHYLKTKKIFVYQSPAFREQFLRLERPDRLSVYDMLSRCGFSLDSMEFVEDTGNLMGAKSYLYGFMKRGNW